LSFEPANEEENEFGTKCVVQKGNLDAESGADHESCNDLGSELGDESKELKANCFLIVGSHSEVLIQDLRADFFIAKGLSFRCQILLPYEDLCIKKVFLKDKTPALQIALIRKFV